MKKFVVNLIIYSGFLLLSPLADAQYVLDPCVEGTVRWHAYRNIYHTYSGGTNGTSDDDYFASSSILKAGWTFSGTAWGSGGAWGTRTTLDHYQPVIKFDLLETTGGSPFPLDLMTTNNFQAFLAGIKAGDVTGEHTTNNIELYKLPQDLTNCQIHPDDHDGFYENYPRIQNLWNSSPPSQSEIDPVDVTDYLRQNLFGTHPVDEIGFTIDHWDFDLDAYQISIPLYQDRIQLEIFMPDAPTPTPAPTTTPGPTATPSPVPVIDFEMNISQSQFKPGDLFKVSVTCRLDTLKPLVVPLVVMLDAFGEFYFYPTWGTDLDYQAIRLTEYEETRDIIEFIWPETGSYGALFMYGALLNQDLTQLQSNVDQVVIMWND